VAGFASISAAGKTIERLLHACFAAEQPLDSPTNVVLIRSDDFQTGAAATGTVVPPALTIFLYRVDFNKAMRAAWSGVGSLDGQAHLPLDLHYLLTPWAENAEYEQRILGKAMQCLESSPILSGPVLYPTTQWSQGEAVQLVLEDVSTEAIMRIFDSLQSDFRLSVPYIARIVRLDGAIVAPDPTVTAVVTGSVAA
jgi:uncharacterized protein DUF4255